MRELLKLETWDHPVVFLFFFALAFVPVLVAIYWGASRVGVKLPTPGAS